jgi:tetratricopeptide (TPR) repeat protein
MSKDRNRRIRDLFERARALDDEELSGFLAEECGDDREIREELRSLLVAYEDASEFLSRAVVHEMPAAPVPLPDKIGRFKILSVLGTGGMGIVYEAEQESPHRKIALKVIGTGLNSPKVLQRFHREAELLARLQHPGIAQIFEAGTFDDDGIERPYIAMELVEGMRLTEYVETQELSVRQRLGLIKRICDAVHHAHQKSVIHRDLKPANILVDKTGCPKILDFGIATATDSDVNLTTFQTDLGQLLGTLPYMSPEQVRGRPGDVDTRSDVYSLGVICYRVLSGRLPHELRDIALAEVSRVVAEEDPERLSLFDRTFRGDIETIVAKALDKQRNRRYQSASDMGEDIQRFLLHEAITARPVGVWYQLQKFSRRNKGLVAGAVIALTGLVAGLVGTTLSLYRTAEAEAAARTEADKYGATSRFFQDVLSSVDPSSGPGKEVTVKEMLDVAARDLDDSFDSQPEVRAVLHDTIGLTYRNIGQTDEARRHLEEALRILRDDPDADQETVASTMGHVAGLYWRLDRSEEAEALVREALEIRTGLYGLLDDRTLELQNNLGILLRVQGRLKEAEALARQTLEAKLVVVEDSNDPGLLTNKNNLASLLDAQGKSEEAEQLYQEVLQGRMGTLGEKHPKTLISIHNLATFYLYAGRLEEAERLARMALEGRTEIYDDRHPDTLGSEHALITVLMEQGNYEEAERRGVDLLSRRTEVLGPNHRDTFSTRSTMAKILRGNERYAEAQAMTETVVAYYENRYGGDHPRTLDAKYDLSLILVELNRCVSASPLLEEIIRLGETVYPEGHRSLVLYRELQEECDDLDESS